jgi:hypothetical protein
LDKHIIGMGNECRTKDGRRQRYEMDRDMEEQRGGSSFNLKEREEGRRKRMMIGQAEDGQEILEEDLTGIVDND